MTQGRLASAVESLANIGVGYLIAYPINWFVGQLTGHPMPVSENLCLITVFSIFSFIRQYAIRRLFSTNWLVKQRIRLDVARLKWKFRNISDSECCCGNDESCCGYGCLPASFVSAKWYAIESYIKHKYGSDVIWR